MFRPCEVNNFYFKFKCRIWWDVLTCTLRSISHMRWNSQNRFFVLSHFLDTFIPSCNDLSLANHKFNWGSSVKRWIKLSSILECAYVVHHHSSSFWNEFAFSHNRFLYFKLGDIKTLLDEFFDSFILWHANKLVNELATSDEVNHRHWLDFHHLSDVLKLIDIHIE